MSEKVRRPKPMASLLSWSSVIIFSVFRCAVLFGSTGGGWKRVACLFRGRPISLSQVIGILQINKDKMSQIAFPESLPALKRSTQIPPTLKYITSLLYRSGTGLSILYAILLLVVQPLLEIQFERRNDMATYALDRARQLLRSLGTELPTVAVKRGDRLYSDASIQTQEEPDKLKITDKVNDKLVKLKDCIEHYKDNCVSINEINPVQFQVKKFQSRIDAYNSVQLFKGFERSMAGKSAGVDMKNDIRTIKGWYLTGQV